MGESMNFELSLIGLFITAVFIGISGIYPGGIIVPSYLVLFINQPQRIITTLIISLITLTCYKLLSRFTLLFGKRRFIFMIITAAFWTYIWSVVFPVLFFIPVEFRVIGWVIPGLIANHFLKQGIFITIGSLTFITILTHIIGKLVFYLF